MTPGLAIFGLVIGLVLILDGIFGWGLVKIVRPASETEIRVSEVVIGAIFVVLAVLILAGVF